MNIFLLTILFVSFCYTEELEENNIDKDIINHDWKLNVISLGHGMIPLGQFENKKPIKALSLMVMKHYWLNEYRSAKTYVGQRDYDKAEEIALKGIKINHDDALIAYYLAVFLGTDVDQPRNLAKSVTVE